MLTNSKLTIYHKTFNTVKRDNEWERYNYDKVWFFGGKGARLSRGLNEANDVEIRIPYFEGLNISNFALGDIIVQGELKQDIDTQQDLDSYLIYNITSLVDNTFGNNPHIHIGGR